ncbi:integrase, catalytic region, zinc finger, CCHC-type containing protein [Tanacetum coccineum]
MLSDNHDLCVHNFINDVNARAKSKSVKKISKRKVWKPTGKIGNVTISRVYYVEGLKHNLFSVGQLCDSNLEVAFRQHTCFIRNIETVDLLNGSRGNNLYTLSLRDMMVSSPICLLSKASKTKSWLWHRRLSHLNFGAINHFLDPSCRWSLPKLKFENDHLCSVCAMGKSKKKPHKPKSEDTNQEKLIFCTWIFVAPDLWAQVFNVKRNCILVIVNDYSRFYMDLLFQPLFDELLNPPPSVDLPAPEVIAPIAEVVALEPAASTEENHDLDVAHMNNDPFFGIPILENDSEASSSSDTKDHPLDNIIGELKRPVSTRLQLHEQALFFYYDAFLTLVEPKTYKDALTQSCWIEAMQEELNEFEGLEVWELVSCPDKVMAITLKWITSET